MCWFVSVPSPLRFGMFNLFSSQQTIALSCQTLVKYGKLAVAPSFDQTHGLLSSEYFLPPIVRGPKKTCAVVSNAERACQHGTRTATTAPTTAGVAVILACFVCPRPPTLPGVSRARRVTVPVGFDIAFNGALHAKPAARATTLPVPCFNPKDFDCFWKLYRVTSIILSNVNVPSLSIDKSEKGKVVDPTFADHGCWLLCCDRRGGDCSDRRGAGARR